MSTARRYGGLSGDERLSERRERLVLAGQELLFTEGIAAITVSAVCDRAGLIRRYFYESFPDRDALLEAVFDKIATDAVARVIAIAVVGPTDPRARLRAVLGAALDDFTADPGFGRIWAGGMSTRTNEVLMRHRTAITEKAVEIAAPLAAVVFGERGYNAPRMRMALRYIIGGCAELVVGWISGTLDTTRDELIDASTDLVLSSATAILANLPEPGQ
jgi:AcrR family transcriptional regulator